MNLMTYAIWLLLNLFVFITIGATALVARFTGARQLDMASRVANQAVFLVACSRFRRPWPDGGWGGTSSAPCNSQAMPPRSP